MEVFVVFQLEDQNTASKAKGRVEWQIVAAWRRTAKSQGFMLSTGEPDKTVGSGTAPAAQCQCEDFWCHLLD